MALSGGLNALLNNFADPTMLNYTQSGEIVIMIVLGGIRSFWGPLIGAAVFVVLQDYLSSLTTNWMSFLGAIFVLMVLFFPRGVLGLHWTEMARSIVARLRQAGTGRKGSSA